MNVLAIGCHPDDLVISCGGTLAKYAERGDKVFMVDIANGNLGHRIIEPDELRIIRQKESKHAAEVLGAENFCIDVGDCLVDSHDEEAQDRLIDIIRFTKPDLIITHNEQDYMRDHVEAGNMAFSASFTAGCSHRITGHSTENPFIENIPPIMYMDTLAGVGFLPTEYVDITDTIAVGDNINDLPMIKAAGLGIGVRNVNPLMRDECDVVLNSSNDEDPLTEVIERFILK